MSGLFLENLSEILPQVMGAILIFIFGWYFSKWLGQKAGKFLEKTKLNQALRRLGLDDALARIDTGLNAPKFFGELMRWSLFIFFLMACSEIIGLVQFSQFLGAIINYLPNIFIASAIFIIAVFLSDFSQKIMLGSFEKEKITYSKFLGKSIGGSIWVLAILAIFYQLGIVPTLILSVFIGVIGMIVISVGIAFGLGGKDFAAKILKELEEKFK